MNLFRRRRLVWTTALGTAALGALLAGLLYTSRGEKYVPGEATDGLVDSLARNVPADHPRVTFTDVTGQAGIDFRHFPAVRSNRLPEDMGSGVALGDIDGDGWVDVFLVNAAGPLAGRDAGWPDSDATNRLYRNRGDGTFEDVTAAAGVDWKALCMAAAFVDVDQDADLDLFVTSYGRCRLYRNDGTGVFEDVSAASGIGAPEGFWAGVAVGDYDGDRDLDLYVCGYVRYEEKGDDEGRFTSQYGSDIPALINPSAFDSERNLLWRNRGDGTFEDVAAAAGVENPGGRSLEATWADLTGDGLPELYVANDVSDNALYINLGDGTFEDRTARALVGDYRGAMGLAWGDFDADLDLDLFITHWVAQENALYANAAAQLAEAGEAPELFFIDEADSHGLGQIALYSVGWACGFFDYDNDGMDDLFVVNGNTIPTKDDDRKMGPMRTHLFWNAGLERGFFEVGPVSGVFFREEWVGRGGATFDYDRDGDEDLLVVRHGAPAILLRNDGGNDRPSLRVRLRQPDGNRLALGAVIEIEAGGRTQRKPLGTQGSYLSQHAAGEVAFGLGDATAVERVRVTWPDGETDEAGPFPGGGFLTWERGEAPRVEAFEKRVASAPSGASPADDVAAKRRFYALVREASMHGIAGEWEQAVATYGQALALRPDHQDSLYYLGNALLELGREPEALAAYEKLVAVEPRGNRGWMQIGRLRLPGGDPTVDDLDAAEAAFSKSLAVNREETGPVVQLGVVAFLKGDLDQADEWFSDAARSNQRSVEAPYYRGWIAWKRGDTEGAQAFLDDARKRATKTGAGPSVSNEGDTRAGTALVSTRMEKEEGPLHRWKTVAERTGDASEEYGE